MAEVLFYHLERARLENILPGLLEKTRQRNWRAVIRAGNSESLETLDAVLWTYADDSFLPHGREGDGNDHPVWLTLEKDMPNNPDLLFLVDGAQADLTELDTLKRCIAIFDGGDEVALEQARGFWRQVKDTPHEATYWRQSVAGKWEKQG